jgi:aryl-phospho-beta-D-glucosidase BglC (GH1 family)
MFNDWKDWGFDHCRYAFAWMADWDIPLQNRLGGPINDDPALWERMDYLVKQHTDRGIMAMLCYFFNEDSPQRDSKNLMRNSTRYWQMHPETRTNCYELWRRIAQRYADYPEGLIAYDFFNEPAYMHRDDWNQIIKDLTKIVRSVDKKHLIVCEAGDGWSQPQWFHWLQPTGDTNTIYSFHHYGKHWGYHYDEYYPGYKSTPEKQMDVLLEAILFSIQHNAPIHCGEFGVSMISPGEDHLKWLEDYLAIFERFGIGWNWWNWDGNGIYRTGLKAGPYVSPNLQILQKSIAKKKEWLAR